MTSFHRRARHRTCARRGAASAVVIVTSLVLAACGSSGSPSENSGASSTTPSSASGMSVSPSSPPSTGSGLAPSQASSTLGDTAAGSGSPSSGSPSSSAETPVSASSGNASSGSASSSGGSSGNAPPSATASQSGESSAPSQSGGSSAAASAAIKKAYATFFDPGSGDQSIDYLQNGQDLKEVVNQQGNNSMASSAKATVSSITLISPTVAKLKYTISVGGNAMLSDTPGYAVKQDGTWKVSEYTFCGLMKLEMGKNAPKACSGATASKPPA